MNDQQLEALPGLIAVHLKPLETLVEKLEARTAVMEILVQMLLSNLVETLQMDSGVVDQVFEALGSRIDSENRDPDPKTQEVLSERKRLMHERLQHMRTLMV